LQDQERLSEALEVFREVVQINPHFRDAEVLVIGLEERLGGLPTSLATGYPISNT